MYYSCLSAGSADGESEDDVRSMILEPPCFSLFFTVHILTPSFGCFLLKRGLSRKAIRECKNSGSRDLALAKTPTGLFFHQLGTGGNMETFR